MTRRELRELAFILLFENAVTGESVTEIIEAAEESRDVTVKDYALKLVSGVDGNIAFIDQAINKYSKTWKIDRLSKVSVSILRICVYELMYEKKIPISVSINEAVELAKIYATQDDASYINGVLSSIAKDSEIIGDKE